MKATLEFNLVEKIEEFLFRSLNDNDINLDK